MVYNTLFVWSRPVSLYVCIARNYSVTQLSRSRKRFSFHATFQLLPFSTLISKQLWMLYSSNFQTAFNLMYCDSLAFFFTSLTYSNVLVPIDIHMSKLQSNNLFLRENVHWASMNHNHSVFRPLLRFYLINLVHSN